MDLAVGVTSQRTKAVDTRSQHHRVALRRRSSTPHCAPFATRVNGSYDAQRLLAFLTARQQETVKGRLGPNGLDLNGNRTDWLAPGSIYLRLPQSPDWTSTC